MILPAAPPTNSYHYCLVPRYANPGSNKDNFRLQLPDSGHWNHRFFFIGLSGSGGHPPTDAEVPRGNPIVKGFAVAGTDKGHQTDALDWSFNSDPAKALAVEDCYERGRAPC